MNKKKKNSGFTLVELIIVIAILGVLMAVLIPQYIQYVEKARAGVRETAELARLVTAHIHAHAGTRIDYASFIDSETLEEVDRVDERTVLALAVHIDDRVRLIDNGFVLPRPTL